MEESVQFSKARMDELIRVHSDSLALKIIKDYIVVGILDFLPEYLIIIWTDLFLFLKFNLVLFLIGFSILFVWCLVWIYIVFIKYYIIKVNKYNFESRDKNGGGLEFIFASDIHIGKRYYGTNLIRLKRIIQKINDQNLDTVVLGGDFVDDSLNKAWVAELKNIKAKNKIAVYGNHDSDYLKEERVSKDPEALINTLEEAGFKVLVNQSEVVEIDGHKLFFGGIPDLYSKRFNLTKLFEMAPKDSTKILLSHNPDIIDFVEDSNDIDLILSGHNHSGMIYLKPFGAILPMPSKYRFLTKGFFDVGRRTKLFLSQGVGYSETRIRIGTESEIARIKIV